MLGDAPELLIVSLGVDIYGGDPISHFKLDRPEFFQLGRHLAAFGAPALTAFRDFVPVVTGSPGS